MSRSEYAARLHAMKEKRKILGQLVYDRVMSAESLLESITFQVEKAAQDKNYVENVKDCLASIRAYLEEL